MKKLILLATILVYALHGFTQYKYMPAPENLEAREWFRDAKYGLFVHWGVYSILGNGEWVMNNREIPIEQYEKLSSFFNPLDFDAGEWVKIVKEAGMKYITVTSKHHDGFAMFDSKVSGYDIVDRTPYGKDVLKQLAEACQKEGIKLFFYYSQLDWHHPEYYYGGRTGGDFTGRDKNRDWPVYLDYMNNQIEELLTQYGPVSGIWFDGWWDKKDADWQLEKTYRLIHELQPACLVGNNHHVTPFEGEDFQMFEKDLPGQNTTGWASGQEVSKEMPLETCETISASGNWGFNIYNSRQKDVKTLVQYLVRAAGYNSNFLLNVGPMPNGKIRPEQVKVLKEIGEWLEVYGESIYGTRGGPITPKSWGVSTNKNNKIYLHILDRADQVLAIPIGMLRIKSVKTFREQTPVAYEIVDEVMVLKLPPVHPSEYDLVIEMKLK